MESSSNLILSKSQVRGNWLNIGKNNPPQGPEEGSLTVELAPGLH